MMNRNTPPATPRDGLRGTDFQLGSHLAESLMNNLQNQFSYSSTPDGTNDDDENSQHGIGSGTQDPDDEALREIDLESLTVTAQQNKLTYMIHQLLIHTIKKPITEYHATLIRRDELIRIRRITTTSIKTSLAAKVATKIQAERAADRPVLSGLIREETEKNTEDLRRQLKSATDQLEHVRQQQNSMIAQYNLKRARTMPSQNTTDTAKKRGGSNKKHKNITWSRSTDNGYSTVAAATSPTIQNSTAQHTRFQPNHQQQQQQWGRPRPKHNQMTVRSSHAADDNASAAARRTKRTKRYNKQTSHHTDVNSRTNSQT